MMKKKEKHYPLFHHSIIPTLPIIFGKKFFMGKGDRKSKKGKIFMGSLERPVRASVRRTVQAATASPASAEPKAAKKKTATKKKKTEE
jgi:hypothetical protein